MSYWRINNATYRQWSTMQQQKEKNEDNLYEWIGSDF